MAIKPLQILPLLAILGFHTTATAQTPSMQEIEKDLASSYKRIFSTRFSDNASMDSVEYLNWIFMKKISDYTSNYPVTLAYKFDSLKKEKVEVVSSLDKNFRIYSWDTWLGGTMRDFRNLFQYKSRGKTYTNIVLDTSETSVKGFLSYYSEIFTLQANNKTYYLAVGNNIYSSRDAGQSIIIYAIEGKQLKTADLIKTKQGLTSSININFDFFSVVNHPERPLKLIKYDNTSKTLYIPLVNEDEKVTKNFLLYKFKGKYFEYIGVKKG